jgi:hypothetical protein
MPPQQMQPPMNPYPDPSIMMFQNMIKNQEDDNSKLRDVLEGLGNKFSKEEGLNGAVDAHS